MINKMNDLEILFARSNGYSSHINAERQKKVYARTNTPTREHITRSIVLHRVRACSCAPKGSRVLFHFIFGQPAHLCIHAIKSISFSVCARKLSTHFKIESTQIQIQKQKQQPEKANKEWKDWKIEHTTKHPQVRSKAHLYTSAHFPWHRITKNHTDRETESANEHKARFILCLYSANTDFKHKKKPACLSTWMGMRARAQNVF